MQNFLLQFTNFEAKIVIPEHLFLLGSTNIKANYLSWLQQKQLATQRLFLKCLLLT